MPPGLGKTTSDPDNDDYVAQVLAKEARDSSMKYSALGMNAYMPARPTGSAPKPNTRFLRHIIKETDNHNAALRRKEEKEARDPMRQLPNSAQSHDASGDQRQHRSHKPGDREPKFGPNRIKRVPPVGDLSRVAGMTTDSEDLERATDIIHIQDREAAPHLAETWNLAVTAADTEGDLFLGTDRLNEASADDSDTLGDLIGPLPKDDAPVRSRGRGAYRLSASNIDAHFAADYDPTLDMHPEDEGVQVGSNPLRRSVAGLMTGDNDWELALGALRDRARWKQRGEDRLRAAGFGNDIVERWKNSASTATRNDEGIPDNVKWSTKSEGREWDRGKFVDKDGNIDVKASW
ncbi:hypothetical protein BJX70DRAFT_402931 [Aspergillus crustosus]